MKVGGSLALKPEKLRSLCAKLSELSQRYSLIVVPGGGEFADAVRNADKRFGLSPAATHRMAILGMEQYGLLLADLLSNSKLVREFESLKRVVNLAGLHIFLPSVFLFSEDALENSWNVTSDSVAVYIAGRLHLARCLLVTDVDGIYTRDPKRFRKAKFIPRLSALSLHKMNERTSVDISLPKLLLKRQIDCFVVNGLYPNRVEDVLMGKGTICTHITASS